MNIDPITNKASQLDLDDRGFNLPSFDISQKEAIALAKQRDEEVDRGVVTPLSHHELMKRLRG